MQSIETRAVLIENQNTISVNLHWIAQQVENFLTNLNRQT
jgi:hypothetical protein